MIPKIIWITGLSGAGKSTLATLLAERLRQDNPAIVLLDGDTLREILGIPLDTFKHHQRDKRLALAFSYAKLCQLLAQQGMTVIIATISLFQEIHQWNRTHLPDYFEIYLNVPLEELRRRDPKGIYQRFDSGEMMHVAGLDVAIDEPQNPDWVEVYSQNRSPEMVVESLLTLWKRTNIHDTNRLKSR